MVYAKTCVVNGVHRWYVPYQSKVRHQVESSGMMTPAGETTQNSKSLWFCVFSFTTYKSLSNLPFPTYRDCLSQLSFRTYKRTTHIQPVHKKLFCAQTSVYQERYFDFRVPNTLYMIYLDQQCVQIFQEICGSNRVFRN